jgi:hypothetical protein
MKVSVLYMGKVTEREQIVPGIVKAGNACLIQCCDTGIWCYCSPERLAKLADKAGSQEAVGLTYRSRDARAEVKRIHLANLAAENAEKKRKEEAEKAQKPATPPVPPTGTPPVPPGVTPAGSGKQREIKK